MRARVPRAPAPRVGQKNTSTRALRRPAAQGGQPREQAAFRSLSLTHLPLAELARGPARPGLGAARAAHPEPPLFFVRGERFACIAVVQADGVLDWYEAITIRGGACSEGMFNFARESLVRGPPPPRRLPAPAPLTAAAPPPAPPLAQIPHLQPVPGPTSSFLTTAASTMTRPTKPRSRRRARSSSTCRPTHRSTTRCAGRRPSAASSPPRTPLHLSTTVAPPPCPQIELVSSKIKHWLRRHTGSAATATGPRRWAGTARSTPRCAP